MSNPNASSNRLPIVLMEAIVASIGVGQDRPQLPADSRQGARVWFRRLMVDAAALLAHVRWIQDRFNCSVQIPPAQGAWREGPIELPMAGSRLPYTDLLPENLARSVAQLGPDALTDEMLATILLNPFALADLHDLIDAELPEFWLDVMEEVGQERLSDRFRNIDDEIAPAGRVRTTAAVTNHVPGAEPGPAVAAGLGIGVPFERRVLPVSQMIAPRLAASWHGDPSRKTRIVLRSMPLADGDEWQPVLELTPAPTASPARVTIRFATGDERHFVVALGSNTSDAADPLPSSAFDYTYGEWHLAPDGVRLVLT
jgi:hypothetical protein